MIPLWKLRRELTRFGQQLRAIPEKIWEPAAQRKHDQLFESGFPVHNGARQQGPNVALLLVYQPNGLDESIFETCEHLVSQGFSPFIVSNTPLSANDIDRLTPHVWRIIERPNFGYDFGGYRDGLKSLWSWGIAPKKLLIINDSIWFPILARETLLHKLDALQADVAGTVLRDRSGEKFLESYCYLINSETFASTEFRHFWNTLKLTSNKYKVIRRGERGHSKALLAAGRDVRGLFDNEIFQTALAKQNTEFLHKTLLYGAHHDAKVETSRRDSLKRYSPDPEWHALALRHVEDALQKGQCYSGFPYAMVHLFAYPILKKSNDQVAKLWRAAYLRAVDADDIAPPSDTTLAEIRCKVNADMA